MTTASPTVHCDGLIKRFSSQEALSKLSFELFPNAIIGLLGPNGAGKTTLLRCLAGLESIDQGELRLFGIGVGELSFADRSAMAFVPDVGEIYPWMTFDQATNFGSSVHPRFDPEMAGEMRDRWEVPRDRAFGKLSRGMKKRFALAFAMATRPRLLLLDEPLSGMDPLAVDETIDVLVRWRDESGGCLLLSSHLLNDVQRIADKIMMMASGRLVLQLTTDDSMRWIPDRMIPDHDGLVSANDQLQPTDDLGALYRSAVRDNQGPNLRGGT